MEGSQDKYDDYDEMCLHIRHTVSVNTSPSPYRAAEVNYSRRVPQMMSDN